MAQGDEIELTRTHRSTDPPGVPAPVQVWGEFRLLEELGRGAFGRVYHAWDATLARDIALKVVTLPDATRAAAALHEGRMLARVRHRNVVTVYGAQQIGDEVGVWMELIRGRHLSRIVREQGPMGPEEATVIGINVCQALAAVHASGLLHRDIKANNVMRESGGRIVLMDFGAGRESGPTAGGDLAGTPVYMAPEVLGGRPASPGSDLYSVGVLLFHLVTGEYPVYGRSVLELSLAHRRNERRLLSDRRPDLPDGFVRVVERALAPSPLDRPPSAGTMLRELTNALSGAGSWPAAPAGPVTAGQVTAIEDLSTPRGYLPAHTEPRGPGTLVIRGTIGILTAFFGLGVLGFLTTAAFNQSLMRHPAFSSDRPVDWWLYGAKALLAPAVLAAVVIMAARLLVTAWHVLLRAVPPLRAAARRLRAAFMGAARWAGAASVAAASQWLLLLQIALLAIVWVRFVDFIETVIQPMTAAPERLALLGPLSNEPLLYRGLVTLLLTGMAAGWYAVLSRPEAQREVHRTTIVAGGAFMILALLMLVVPYRLLYHSEMPRADYGDARCYELGVRDAQVLLYCPNLPPPRVMTVDSQDSKLTRPNGIPVSIFSPASSAQ
jgi:hypothetical protein